MSKPTVRPQTALSAPKAVLPQMEPEAVTDGGTPGLVTGAGSYIHNRPTGKGESK